MTTHDQSGPRPGDVMPTTDVSDHSVNVSDHSADVYDDSRRSHPGARAKSSVVIVGGGLSGLAAAEALARARPAGDPTTITVLEA
ncbi:MAG: NAD(P)-binding protein, partial [Planctomycetota bacterium]